MANNKIIFEKFIKSKREKFNTSDMCVVWVVPYYNLRDQFVFRYYIFKHAADQRRGKTLKWQDLTK